MDKHSTQIQRAKLLKHLQENGSATTTEIRHQLDIMMPAARIHELRHNQNINIGRTWDIAENPGGTDHKVALYVLLSGTYSGGEHAST